MMERIIHRFMNGLVADIQPPNLETRMAILRKKAETDGISLPAEVVSFLAANITSNVRELEGSLIRLIASSSFTGRDITLEVAKKIGQPILRRNESLSVKCIQQKVAEAWGISPNQLSAHTRKRDVSLPRAVAIYLCKKWTRQSLTTIGLEFGRDDSTVIQLLQKDRRYSRHVNRRGDSFVTSWNRAGQKVLVLQTSFLGDTVLTLPLIDEIKRRFPVSHLTADVQPARRGAVAGSSRHR